MNFALIVDKPDKDTSLLIELLAERDIRAECLESATDISSYLQRSTPDVIFMGQLLPGSEGYSALKSLRAETGSADIPVVMFTSKKNEVYFGQARALGAADLLGKPPTPADLDFIINKLAERRAEQEQQETVESHETMKAPSRTGPAGAAEVAPGAPVWMAFLLGALLILAALLAFSQFRDNQNLEDQNAGLQQLLQQSLDYSPRLAFNEAPFDVARSQRLLGYVRALVASGYRGKLVIEVQAGEFCVEQSDTGFRPISGNLSLDECDAVMTSPALSEASHQRQRARLRQALMQAAYQAADRLLIELRDTIEPGTQQAYPSADGGATAAQWNRAAEENNRLQLLLIEGQ